jgi:hypothetical protein
MQCVAIDMTPAKPARPFPMDAKVAKMRANQPIGFNKEKSTASVEERLAKVEKEIEELKAKTENQSSKQGWLKKIEGSFQDDPDFLEIVKLGKEARDAEKPQD